MDHDLPSTGALLTVDDVRRWIGEHAAIGEEIKLLTLKREEIEKKLSVVRSLVSPDRLRGVLDVPTPPMKVARKVSERKTWTGLVRKILEEAGIGMTHEDLRASIRGGEFSERLVGQEKSFYGAINKLKSAGHLVPFNGRFYSKAAFREVQDQLDRGVFVEEPLPRSATRRSEMQDAIIKLVNESNGGLASREIIAELKSRDDFAFSINRNQTHVYNVLTKLVRRGDLKKQGMTYTSP